MRQADRILIIDDDESMRFFLREALMKEGAEVEEASDAETGLMRMEVSSFDLVITDVKLPGMTGIEAMPMMKEKSPDVVIIVMTALGARELAHEAVKSGAYDYFLKPLKLDEMSIIIRRALEKRHLQRELKELQEKFSGKSGFGNLIGTSSSMQGVYEMIERVAPTDTTVLVYGETGTGKELVAEAIHENSRRRDRDLVRINCAAIPEALLESELFGYERGAFTGAIGRKPGKLEVADGGTIFLDEVGDMGIAAQAKLLRVLQGSEFERVGGVEPVTVNVRVIAATNKVFHEEMEKERFRADLAYRLSGFTIAMPPLREKRDDIPLLVDHFVTRASIKQNKQVKGISKEVMALLMDYHWPGNVRQLELCVERAVVMTDGNMITPGALPLYLQETEQMPYNSPLEKGLALGEFLMDTEKKVIVEALEKTGGVQVKAAKLLGISERSLWHRVKKLNIDVEKIKQLRFSPDVEAERLC
jgi:DNA-binding NtrC family response regulator